jgi:hypothetical protein
MAHESASPQLERVKYLGTTWHKRGAAYWARRAWVVFVGVVILTITVSVSFGAFLKLMRDASGDSASQAVFTVLFALFTLFGIFESYIGFYVSSSQKRDYLTERDKFFWKWWKRSQRLSSRSNPGALTAILTLVLGFLAIGFGAGMMAALGIWFIALNLQKYASPEEYAAVRRSQGLPPVDHKALLASTGQEPQQERLEKPEKLPLLGRSWAKRGAWYWTRRLAWTVFFVWIASLAVRIAVEAVVLCAQGQWLQNRALAVGLALAPVAGSVFVGARGLLTFWRTVREDRDSRSGEWKYVGWVSLRQRAVGGVGGLLVFWYFYNSPRTALMHAAPGSARAFARFLLLFVVGIVLAWALACFGKYFGPEEYDAVRAMQFSGRIQARIDEVHESFQQTEAERRYQRDEAWRPPPRT